MRIRIIVLLVFLNFVAGAQKDGGYAGGNGIDDRILLDKRTGIRYVLDSSRVYLVAIKYNKVLWYTDVWRDNKLKSYKVERPVISEMLFVFSETDKNKEVIWILYNNTQYGEVDKKTGKFLFLGQE